MWYMQRIRLLIICSMIITRTQSRPINNGFSVKFTPFTLKGEPVPKNFGALFAKIPQDVTLDSELQKQVLAKAYIPQSTELGIGCTNQVAKIVFPSKTGYSSNDTSTWANMNFINLPFIKQPYDDYKILVATAPPHVKMGNKRLIIYVVFPGDGNNDDFNNIPKIYFVNERNVNSGGLEKKELIDPVLVIDSNRTVTGLKSREISKFIRFKSKLANRYKYKYV